MENFISESMVDGTFRITIPTLGMVTYSKDENEDAELAVKEAIELFRLNAEIFGDGVEEELNKIKREV